MTPATPSIATIEAVGLTATHDGEAALVVTIRFPTGGATQLQIPSVAVAEIMRRANFQSAGDMVGEPWQILNIAPVGFRS